jgi:ligand-binding sensor domain-containing protein
MKKIIVLGLILALGNLTFLAAQTVGSWENYVNPEMITEHVETTNEIWFSTKAGVLKLDKSTMQVTTFNPANSNVPSNKVEHITKDANGNIWIGTYDQAIAKYDGTNWTAYAYPNNFFNSLSTTVETYCVEVDNQGIVWIGTSEGLARFDGTNWNLYHSQNGAIIFQDVWALEVDSQGDLLIAGNDVFKFNGTTFTNISSTTNLNFYGDAILFEASNGDIWASTKFGAIGIFDGTNWTEYNNSNGAIPFVSVYDLGESTTGEMFFTSNLGKYVLQNGTWTLQAIVSNTYVTDSELEVYFYDNQGNEWFGNGHDLVKNNGTNLTHIAVKTNGINSNEILSVKEYNGLKYILTEDDIVTFDGSTWETLSIPSNLELKSIQVGNAQNIWLNTYGDGVFNWNGTTWTNYNTSNSAILTNYLKDILWDEGKQTLWARGGTGLVKFDGTIWTYFDPSNSPLTDDNIRSLGLDNNGVLYVSVSSTQADIFRYDGITWTNISAGTNAPGNAISQIHFDKDNTLWAASWILGLFKYENGTWTNWNENNSDLPYNHITALTSDTNGKLYMGTYSAYTKGGAASFDGTNWEILSSVNSGLSDNDVNAMKMDGSGKLWFATEHGLSSLQTTLTSTTPIIFENTALKVFPNPIEDNATLQFTTNNATDKIRISVISLDGKTISDVLIEGRRAAGLQQLEIQKQGWASGLYYLQVQYNEVKMVEAILVR